MILIFNEEGMFMAYEFTSRKKTWTAQNVHQKALCGTLVKDTPIPTWSVKQDHPFAVVEDAKVGEAIGFSMNHLARGTLLLGAAGTGKTNVSMILVSSILKKLHEGDILFIFDSKGDYFEEFAEQIGGGQRKVIGSDEIYEDITWYGMHEQQICRLIRLVSEELGADALMDKILLYAMALMEIVAVKYTISLPAITQLLILEDEEIADLTVQENLSPAVKDNIRGNREAGLLVRRIVECLNKTFDCVAERNSETGMSLQKLGQEKMPHAAFYMYSCNQKIMNTYLKEELILALQKNHRIRVIADEILASKDDELLRYLHEMKRVGRIELIWCSENVRDVLSDENMNFTNVCIFSHATVAAMELVSEILFGKYLYHFPVQTVGRPPNFLFTFLRDEHWTLHTEERLRVRAIDLQEEEKLAIKIGKNDHIFLVPLQKFQ